MSDSPRNHRQPAGVIFFAFFTFVALVCAGTYSGGSGTAEDPYRISTVADWQELIGASDDWDKQFNLLNDIEFDGMNLTPVAPDTYREPLEFRDTPFNGVMDGNGYVLSHLKIGGVDDFYVGLFGGVGSSGQIRNLGVKNVTMAGNFSVGGLVGVNYGTIDSCYASDGVSVTCEMYAAGGLVGFNQGLVNSCYSTSDINSSGNYVGGLIGWNDTGTITTSYATGTVNGVSDGIGGLVGTNGGAITDCYTTGTVSGSSIVGGLVGENWEGTITDCYTTSPVSGAIGGSGDNIGGLVGRNVGWITACYAAGTVSGSSEVGGLVGVNSWKITACYAIGAVGRTGKTIGGLVGMSNKGIVNGSFWDTQTTGQTISAGGIGMTTGQMKMLSYYKFAGWEGKGWVMQNNIDYPRLNWENTEGIAIPPAGFSCAGSGEYGDPYQISTISDWQDLIANTDGWYSKCYILINDIDFGGIGLFPVAPATLPNPWEIQDQPFTGFFDGNGHILSNFKISGTGDEGVGLFGYLCSGLIQNLGVENATITGHGKCTGGLVGYMYQSWITACSFSGTVSGSGDNDIEYIDGAGPGDRVGGLVGLNREGVIEACHTAGTVSGKDRVGGLVGNNWGTITACSSVCTVSGVEGIGGLTGGTWKSTISNCASTGAVSGHSVVGGLVGSHSESSIAACYATGTVSGNDGVGGLVGAVTLGTIADCFASGAIGGTQEFYIGGLVGYSWNSTVMSSFWDIDTSGQNTSVGGEGLATAEMKREATFLAAGWDFIDESRNGVEGIWRMDADGVDYPRLWWEFDEEFGGGKGTAEDPYRILTARHLNSIGGNQRYLDKHFVLLADIDMSEYDGKDGRPEYQIIAPNFDEEMYPDRTFFAGVFDGRNHTIRNLVINRPGRSACGLMGGIDNDGTVNNLKLFDVRICGNEGVGGLAGYNRGHVTHCEVSGMISAVDLDSEPNYFIKANAGGLVGLNIGVISQCRAHGAVSGDTRIGGLVGLNYRGAIKDSYSTASVDATGDMIGGFVGATAWGSFVRCYSTGTVSGVGGNIGGLVGIDLPWIDTGDLEEITVIQSCFWDMETSDIAFSAGGVGKTTAEMKTRATFTGAEWDFVREAGNGTTDVWRMCADGIDYPRLSWEFSQGGDMDCPDGVAMEDLLYLAGRWLASTPATFGAADTNADGRADLMDLAILSENWGHE
jgi:hypothetical protein